jgi:hypothetical protein
MARIFAIASMPAGLVRHRDPVGGNAENVCTLQGLPDGMFRETSHRSKLPRTSARRPFSKLGCQDLPARRRGFPRPRGVECLTLAQAIELSFCILPIGLTCEAQTRPLQGAIALLWPDTTVQGSIREEADDLCLPARIPAPFPLRFPAQRLLY